jgi:hypothetical protein
VTASGTEPRLNDSKIGVAASHVSLASIYRVYYVVARCSNDARVLLFFAIFTHHFQQIDKQVDNVVVQRHCSERRN